MCVFVAHDLRPRIRSAARAAGGKGESPRRAACIVVACDVLHGPSALATKDVPMSQLSQILVPVDFSECSGLAVHLAGHFAGAFRAEIDLLHVTELPEFVPDETAGNGALATLGLVELAEKLDREKLDMLVAGCLRQGIKIRRAITERGRPSDVVIDVARRGNYDLLTIATHGRTGFSRVLLGSVAERVVRQAPCPVLSARAPSLKAHSTPRRVLVPVDYSPFSRSALSYAEFLARTFGAELDVVHVWDRPTYISDDTVIHDRDGKRMSLTEMIVENAEHEMQQFLRETRPTKEGLLPKHRLLSGEPVSTLLSEIEKGSHDLVVVGTQGRTGLKHLLLGSVAERLVRLSTVAVVTVPPEKPTAP
jgi:nucleotide-binding universal stress UspA family protein